VTQRSVRLDVSCGAASRKALNDPVPTYGNPTWPSASRTPADVQSVLMNSDWSNASAPNALLVNLTRVRHYSDTAAPAAPLSGWTGAGCRVRWAMHCMR
jgi:hypothetical protein